MKRIVFLLCALYCILCFKMDLQTEQLSLKKLHSGYGNEVISPGRGYSTDRQQISPIVCFNNKISPYGKSQSIVRLDQGYSYNQIENTLKVDVSTKIGVGMFSIEAGAEYMKYIKDTEYSMSINYYQFVQSDVTTQMGFGPAGALTADGLRAYGSVDRPNPRFGLICGDMFISSFKVGAQLVFSIKLQFSSHTEKESFAVKFGVGFGSFVSISTDIQKVVSQTNSSGSMTILAYQSGGNPAQLAKILNSSCGSNYCAATCSMQRLTDCNSAVNGLLKYAINSFPTQVDLQDVRTLSSFPLGFAKLQNIKWIGLETSPSYVTKDVVAMRQTLADKLLENQYYLDTMTTITKGKLPWVKDSNFYKQVIELINITKFNTALLMDQNEGGIICYQDPQSCPQDGNTLVSRLKPIDETHLQNIYKVTSYKLQITPCRHIYYRIGDGKSTSDWYNDGAKSPNCQSVTSYKINTLQLVDQIHLFYNITVNYPISGAQIQYFFTENVNAQDANSSFLGTQVHQCKGYKDDRYAITLPRTPSEYGFQLYK